MMQAESYWHSIWQRFQRHRLGVFSLIVVILFCLVGVYAPFLASSKPLFVLFDGQPYFPLFRYLFYSGFFTKRLDIFFNLLIFTMPLALLTIWLTQGSMRRWMLLSLVLIQLVAFGYFGFAPPHDPASDVRLTTQRQEALAKSAPLSWSFDLQYMNDYARLNLVLQEYLRRAQQRALTPYLAAYAHEAEQSLPTLWQVEQDNLVSSIKRYRAVPSDSPHYADAQAHLRYIIDRQQWIEEQLKQLHFVVMPLLSHFHWEDDAGGQQALNQYVPWWDLTRINRKDLLSALIFGVRISLVVGTTAVSIALLIGIPIGSLAGYYAGTTDIVVCRLLEIWEAMPTFFMLLMVVAILQSKSIFLVIAVIGLFGWTTFSRYVRGEFFKQRNLPYVEASHALGFRDGHIIFKEILPNAVQPVLTLLPFAVMGAITSEAGLSFLGLGEEGSCSWGVLMDEGRSVFPQESYLLWPPAILLTLLLIAIALVGDSLRDALDPKSA